MAVLKIMIRAAATERSFRQVSGLQWPCRLKSPSDPSTKDDGGLIVLMHLPNSVPVQ